MKLSRLARISHRFSSGGRQDSGVAGRPDRKSAYALAEGVAASRSWVWRPKSPVRPTCRPTPTDGEIVNPMDRDSIHVPGPWGGGPPSGSPCAGGGGPARPRGSLALPVRRNSLQLACEQPHRQLRGLLRERGVRPLRRPGRAVDGGRGGGGRPPCPMRPDARARGGHFRHVAVSPSRPSHARAGVAGQAGESSRSATGSRTGTAPDRDRRCSSRGSRSHPGRS